MNKNDKIKLKRHAVFLLNEWNNLVLESTTRTPHGKCSSWYMHDARQAYRDALESLKQFGLIKEYKLPNFLEM